MKKRDGLVRNSVRIGIGLGLFLIILALVGSSGLGKESDFQRTLTVTGEGVVNTAPDIVRLRLGTEFTDSSLATVLSKTKRKMNAVVEIAKELGISKKNRQTVRFDVSVQRDQEGKLTGYQAIYMLEVTIQISQDRLGRVGSFLDKAIAAGANKVAGITFAIGDKKKSLEKKARIMAVRDARAKAKQLSRAAGVSLGPPLTIERTTERVEPAGKMRALGTEGPVPVQKGQLQIKARITIVYALS